MPTRDDALAVRRFAQARRRAQESEASPETLPSTTASMDIATALAAMDAERREISMLFAHALMRTAAPDMLARGKRVALNFADAVAQRSRDVALRDNDGSR